jgi:large subunit ribosomal protein L29
VNRRNGHSIKDLIDMSQTKPSELRELSESDLKQRLEDARRSLTEMRFKKAVTGQLENPSRIRQTRRDISRMLTILTEKQGA